VAEISERSRRLLWGRAAGHCSFLTCREPLTHRDPDSGDASNFGHEAHIVGDKSTAARGRSPLSETERNDYSNLILLCRNHHAEIDDKISRKHYPVERLHEIKSSHEQWVEEHLSRSDRTIEAADRVYTKLIDDAVVKCGLDNWRTWTFNALNSTPFWRTSRIHSIIGFRDSIVSAVFYHTRPELEAALTRFGHVLAGAALHFESQAEDSNADDWERGDQFYRLEQYYTYAEPQRALRDLYERWQQGCYDRIYESSACANWLADVVRREFNPMFFAIEGRFMLEEHVNSERRMRCEVYSSEQRQHYTEHPLTGFSYSKPLHDELRAINEMEQASRARQRKGKTNQNTSTNEDHLS
jgi:hypothetical protein